MITIREVLFKAKRTDNGKWIEGSLIRGVFVRCADNQDIPYILNIDDIECDYDNFGDLTDGFGYYEVNPDTICQFTGLVDKNGDKIWESDIVSIDEELYVVTWEEDDAMFALEDVGVIEHFSNVDSKWCEVIGNKIDNPEFFLKIHFWI